MLKGIDELVLRKTAAVGDNFLILCATPSIVHMTVLYLIVENKQNECTQFFFFYMVEKTVSEIANHILHVMLAWNCHEY